jgi:hypothetical protein
VRSDSSDTESFYALQVGANPTQVTHTLSNPNGSEEWAVTWFDQSANATYILSLKGGVAARLGAAGALSPDNASSAAVLVDLAAKSHPLRVTTPPPKPPTPSGCVLAGAQPYGSVERQLIISCDASGRGYRVDVYAPWGTRINSALRQDACDWFAANGVNVNTAPIDYRAPCSWPLGDAPLDPAKFVPANDCR